MSEVKVYGLCDANCRHQVLTVDQTVDLIQEMAANNWQVPQDFIPQTSVNGIIEQNSGNEVSLWVGTQAQYDILPAEKKGRLFAIISDDPTLKIIENKLSQHGSSIENINSTITKIAGEMSVDFGECVISRKKLIWNGSITCVNNNGYFLLFDAGNTIGSGVELERGTLYEIQGTLTNDANIIPFRLKFMRGMSDSSCWSEVVRITSFELEVNHADCSAVNNTIYINAYNKSGGSVDLTQNSWAMTVSKLYKIID